MTTKAQNLSTREELADAWEYVLTHHTKLSEGMRNLLQSTIAALRGEEITDRQKVIDTWTHMLIEPGISKETTKRIDATLYYLLR